MNSIRPRSVSGYLCQLKVSAYAVLQLISEVRAEGATEFLVLQTLLETLLLIVLKRKISVAENCLRG